MPPPGDGHMEAYTQLLVLSDVSGTQLVFEVDTPFYPEVTVTFRVTGDPPHLHVPILLSPFAFTTSRGS